MNNFTNLNWKFNKTLYERITICKNNKLQMINPYSYFGINDIWPRGFNLKDLNKDDNTTFFNLASTQINLEPLIYQGLINGISDLDAIFLFTRIEKKKNFEITFSKNYPLMYLPGNYVPINSKNTKYLYNIFPALPLPTTLNEKISDIFRGYIMQSYAWRNYGTVIYISSDSYKNVNNNLNILNLQDEKDLYIQLDKLLTILKNENNSKIKDPFTFIINLIKKLVSHKLLGKMDLLLYKAFIKDLLSFGYNFNKTLNYNFNENNYFSNHSKLYINLIHQQYILLKNNNKNINIKIIKHKFTNRIYSDILLAINYNFDNLIKLNEYLIELYNKTFPNIVFISPGNISNSKTISCKNSNNGNTAYMCFRKIYDKFPNFKGYLIIDDDNLFKPWEMENLNFELPWINIFDFERSFFTLFQGHKEIEEMLSNNKKWINDIYKLVGNISVPKLWVDSLYIPNTLMINFCNIVEKMYNHKIFLELAIPTSFGIMSLNEYQITNSIFIWDREQRIYMNKYLKQSFSYLCIHPIKFSNLDLREEVKVNAYFINAEQY